MKRDRETILKNKISAELTTKKPNVYNLIKIFEQLEIVDIKTLNRLKLQKKLEVNRINGALKQCIHSHGPITINNISSASKRIYGSLLTNVEDKKYSFSDILIGVFISFIIMLLVF